MTTKRVVPVPEDLLLMIDEQRSDLERDEFIRLCINMALDQDAAMADDTDDEEVVCVLPTGAAYGAVAAAALPTGSPAAQRARRSYSAVSTEADQGVPAEETLPLGWWIPAFLLFGFGDTLTSALVFARGGVELNPVMRFALSLPGGLWSFALAKTIFLAILLMIGLKAGETLRWVIPLLTTAVGSYLVWNNIFTFLKLL